MGQFREGALEGHSDLLLPTSAFELSRWRGGRCRVLQIYVWLRAEIVWVPEKGDLYDPFTKNVAG